MSKKIIGAAVGNTVLRPNFNQTDPTKGDYIMNKPDFEGLQNEVTDLSVSIGSYLLNIDYDAILAFDTSEVIFGSNTSSVLGQAILGQMVLA